MANMTTSLSIGIAAMATAATVLTGCSSEPAPTAAPTSSSSTATPTSTSVTTSAALSGDDADRFYIQQLTENGVPFDTESHAIQLAHVSCGFLSDVAKDNGGTATFRMLSAAQHGLIKNNPEYSEEQAQTLITNALVTYCPELAPPGTLGN